MTNSIQKTADFAVPIERLWRAITDHVEFGAWFRVALEAPFAVGETARGRVLYPGFEKVIWEAKVTQMQEPSLFAFTWHPYAIDPEVDYSKEEPTVVEFRLEPTAAGTRLTITETGFDALPDHRRPDALRLNDKGWTTQLENIGKHVQP